MKLNMSPFELQLMLKWPVNDFANYQLYARRATTCEDETGI